MKVFLDLDSCIVDFNRGTHRAFGKIYNPKTGPTQWNYYREWGITFEEFNAVCTTEFWIGLDFMHDGLDIFDAVSNKFPDKDIYFLTAPMPNPGSWPGKVEWVRRHFSTFWKRLIITQAPKSLLAKPDTLLVDDKDENIAEFVAAGGQGILVPRPWNELHGWANETLQVVKNSLEGLKT